MHIVFESGVGTEGWIVVAFTLKGMGLLSVLWNCSPSLRVLARLLTSLSRLKGLGSGGLVQNWYGTPHTRGIQVIRHQTSIVLKKFKFNAVAIGPAGSL